MSRPEAELVGADDPRPEDRPEAHPVPAQGVGPVQPEGEQGGPKGPEPTRFGDWEKNGRCFDF